jgi:site-specific DNA-adenine methylase
MKNHFFFSYFGNKRQECEKIFDNINLDGITTIIEPFCGSCAMSFYLSSKYPKKFKYILNDTDKNLIDLLKIGKYPKKLKKLSDEINKLCFINDIFIDKEIYKTLLKKNDTNAYIIKNKYYGIRKGLYPMDRKMNKAKFEDCPMSLFLKDEKITLSNGPALDIINKYKDDKTVLILNDPPYFKTSFDFYNSAGQTNDKMFNIYEWLLKNDITNFKCKFYLILEDIWIIRLLFDKVKDNFIVYDKKYELSKRHTQHILIKNIV